MRIDSTSLGTKYKLVHQELIYERMEEDNVNNQYSSIYTRLTNAKVDLTTTDVTFYTAPSDADLMHLLLVLFLVSEDIGNADTITVTLTRW